jgi:hypothetical protein
MTPEEDVLFAILFVAAGLIWGTIGFGCSENSWKAETVRRGVAEYLPETGKWQWKQEYRLEDNAQ